MNNIQKISLIVGVLSTLTFLFVCISTGDCIFEAVWSAGEISYYDEIAMHSFIPFLITIASLLGFFLFKDK